MGSGVVIQGEEARGRLEGGEIWANAGGGAKVSEGSDPALIGCTIRDHTELVTRASGCGVFVHPAVDGRAIVGPDCVFARNARGDVVRVEAGGR